MPTRNAILFQNLLYTLLLNFLTYKKKCYFYDKNLLTAFQGDKKVQSIPDKVHIHRNQGNKFKYQFSNKFFLRKYFLDDKKKILKKNFPKNHALNSRPSQQSPQILSKS